MMAANINDTTAAAFVYSYLQEKDPKYAETFKKKTNAVSFHFVVFYLTRGLSNGSLVWRTTCSFSLKFLILKLFKLRIVFICNDMFYIISLCSMLTNYVFCSFICSQFF